MSLAEHAPASLSCEPQVWREDLRNAEYTAMRASRVQYNLDIPAEGTTMLKPGSGASPTGPVFGSSDVCQIARISPRQLQWWDENKVASPCQQGHRRIYTPEDVIGIMVIAELRRKGLSLQKIRRVARFFQREVGPRLEETVRCQSALHLLTDGKSLHLEELPERIIEHLKKSRQPMLLVSVSDQVGRLAEFTKARGKASSRILDNQLKLY